MDRGKGFSDSHPTSIASCQPHTVGSQTYQQYFPVSTRVLNGIKIDDQQEIISIGLTWVKNEAEKTALLEYIHKAQNSEDPNHQERRENIEKTAEGELLGLFLVETDDHLGTAF